MPLPGSLEGLLDLLGVDGCRLQVFFGGYPLHFDWTKFTDLKIKSRNARFDFWVGYDF